MRIIHAAAKMLLTRVRLLQVVVAAQRALVQSGLVVREALDLRQAPRLPLQSTVIIQHITLKMISHVIHTLEVGVLLKILQLLGTVFEFGVDL